MKPEIVLCGGKRTPFGDFGKSLKDVSGTDLGIHAAKACLAGVGLDAAEVDHLVCGNVVPVDQGGYFSSRVIALGSGLGEDSCALNVSPSSRGSHGRSAGNWPLPGLWSCG